MNIYTICYRLVLAAVLWEQVASVFQDDFNIPVTVEVPSGHENDTLRLHLAAYGAVPYGEVMAGCESRLIASVAVLYTSFGSMRSLSAGIAHRHGSSRRST